jgi:signal transduction histidine kinase
MFHYSSHEMKEEEGLPYLRDKLFISILILGFPICFLVYIPSMIVSLITNQFIIGIFDTIAMMVFLFIFMYKNQSMKAKKILFSAIFYILSIILLIYLGIKGPSIIILLCISVLITLFQSKRAGLIAVALNAVIFLFFLAVLPIQSTSLSFFLEYNIETWIGVGLNLIAFNCLVVLSVSSLVDQLNESFLKEKKLQLLLKRESLDLLSAKQKAEESDRLKSAFLANMSHEVRTPLNSIIGFTELLADPYFEEEQKSEFIQHIVSNGNTLLSVISDIMDISKLESGEITIRKSQINAQEFISGIKEQFALQTEAKNLELKLTIPDTYDEIIVFADIERLKQIFNNLIGNAIKFTANGSIEIGYQPKGKMVEFYVRDTGIGIPAEYHDKIFERFRQVEGETMRKFGGNGLGLAISKNLVELMGGKIWIESKVGEGSVFYFTMPMN